MAIVVHPSNDSILVKSQLRKIYLGKSQTYPNGAHVIPLDNSSKGLYDYFLANVLRKNESNLNSYWSRMIFSGKGKPPKQVDGSADVLEIVSKNKSAIGYVKSDEVDGRVKVILTIE
ncbi:MAG: phosphate ABC transporter substrate-binding protein [Alphaproteobacteria bacterium]|nr:phosphate ABC transporter substrate-binding protein [Alphaproteobacteria bacterium]